MSTHNVAYAVVTIFKCAFEHRNKSTRPKTKNKNAMTYARSSALILIPALLLPVMPYAFFLRMSQSPLGVGVIGCGRIGQIHSNTLAFRTPGARLVAITDPFEDMGKKVLDQTGGIPSYHKNYLDLLDEEDIKAVVVASPTPYHVEQIMAAVERGKHVFCEKPISNDLATIDSCIEAAAKAGTKLILGFQRRFDANFQAVKQQIVQGAIGKVRTIRIVSRDPAPPPADYLKTSGGIFLDMSSHDFDMARFLVGSDIEEVFVQGTAWGPEAAGAGDLDTQITLLRFENGVFGTLENSRLCSFGYDQRVEVFGELGSLQGENRSPSTVTRSDAEGVTAGLPYSFFMDRYGDAYVDIVRAFVREVSGDGGGGVEHLASAADGKATVMAGMAAKASVQGRRLVKVSEMGR